MSPPPSTPPGGRQLLWELVRPYRSRLAALSLTSFLGGLVEAAFLVVAARTGLSVAGGSATTTLLGVDATNRTWIAAAALMLAARFGLTLGGIALSTRLSTDVVVHLRRSMADAYLHAAWARQQADRSGRLQHLLGELVQSAVTVLSALAVCITAALSLVAMLGTAVLADPITTVFAVGALTVLGSVLAPLRRRLRGRARSATRSGLAFATTVSEASGLGLEIQAFGVQPTVATEVVRLARNDARAKRRVLAMSAATSATYTTLAYVALLAGLAIASAVSPGRLANMGTVMLVMLRSLSYGQQAQSSSVAIVGALPAVEQFSNALTEYRGARATSGSTRAGHVGAIVADSVGYEYHPGVPVLSDVSFTIDKGEFVGVVGPSGSGKSTLIQLLLGLRSPTEGCITVDGVDLADIDRSWWAEKVAFVPQDANLITGTVADNLRFFRTGIDDAALRRAAAQANILTDIEALPHGFDTHLGERGESLSGGQRQRLSIARALAGSPELVILDEPTSALDAGSEALIRDTMEGFRGTVTLVVIAHRLSTLERCDRIVVVEQGRITGIGTPETLRSNSGFYLDALTKAGLA